MTKNILIKGLIAATMVVTLALPMAAMATPAQISPNDLLPTSVSDSIGLTSTDIRVTIAKIIKSAMSLLGIVAVLIILYGGFKWMTAAGAEEAVGEAKKIIISGIIGLIIILTAYAIATFVIGSLLTATA